MVVVGSYSVVVVGSKSVMVVGSYDVSVVCTAFLVSVFHELFQGMEKRLTSSCILCTAVPTLEI